MSLAGFLRRAGQPWLIYLMAGAFACALYLWFAPLKGSGPLMNLIGLSPVVAILVGVQRYKPRSRLPWYLLAAGSALFWLGDLYTYSYPLVLRSRSRRSATRCTWRCTR